MACALMKRKRPSIEKDSEMGSGRFSTKKYKVEYFTNVHEEVRTKLKGHRPLLCVETIFTTRLNEICNCCKDINLTDTQKLKNLLYCTV